MLLSLAMLCCALRFRMKIEMTLIDVDNLRAGHNSHPVMHLEIFDI